MRRLWAGAIAIALAAAPAAAEPRHGLSAFGDLKYPADFQHFDYVDPNAPKGGRIVTIGTEGRITFDSLNGYILKGVPAQRLDLLFDSLMLAAGDEPDAVYGLVAKTADLADDRMSVAFEMRAEARFGDGTPVTAADACASFELLKTKGHPNFRVSLRDVTACTVTGALSLRYDFTGQNVRDLPMAVATLPIFSKAYYGANEFDATTLKAPLGSGPYEIADLKQGQFITYRLRGDYWAKDLPINRGRYNFGEIKLLYFRDRTAELEALKAGLLDLREEFTSKSWATEYDLPAVREGRLIKAELQDETASGAQGFFINMRREKFADPRVREALGLAYDFEWSNANLFFGRYTRTSSFFENSAMKAEGKPGAEELALLEPLRAELGEAAFGEPVTAPASDGSGQDRALLRRASQLLGAAGWRRQGNRLVNGKGEQLSVEFLIFSPTFERVIAPFVRNLTLLGIDASIRQVEAAQYQERLKNFDFDVTTQRFTMSQTPGVELRAFFGSENADVAGSFNLAGLRNAGIDALIGSLIQADTREKLTMTARALDRALRAQYLWVPHWYKASHSVAYWDLFGRPAVKPRYARGILDTWWIDPARAASLKKGP